MLFAVTNGVVKPCSQFTLESGD